MYKSDQTDFEKNDKLEEASMDLASIGRKFLTLQVASKGSLKEMLGLASFSGWQLPFVLSNAN